MNKIIITLFILVVLAHTTVLSQEKEKCKGHNCKLTKIAKGNLCGANVKNCSGFIAKVIDSLYGIKTFVGKTANQQYELLVKGKFTVVTGEKAAFYATERHKCVLYAYKNKSGHGHIGIVWPGKDTVINGVHYPLAISGGMNKYGRSDGAKNVAQQFKKSEWRNIKYFVL